MGCASSTPLTASGPSPEAPPYDLRGADPGALAGDDSVAGKVRQTVTGMADALPVQEMIDGVTHAKDGAFHKLQDFGETVKDKVESVVEDVEDKIGSALGTVKEKTTEATEEVSAAKEAAEEEMGNAVEEVKEMAETAETKAEDEAKEAVDTMVEDLEESLPLPEKQDSESKDFQINTTKGSRASTAELSRKSGDEGVVEEVTGEEEVKKDQPESSKDDGGNDNMEEKNTEEEISSQEQNSQSPQNESMKSGKTSPVQTESPEDTGITLRIDQKTMEDPIEAETNAPVEAIPIDKDETPKEESKAEEEKEITEGKESLTVDLPPENQEGGSPSGAEENEPLRTESQNNQSSPIPHPDTPRPPPDSDENHGSVEPLIEKTTITPPEDQPELDLDTGTRSPSSPDGKNDSAISSSSLSPEHEVTETGMGERQGTPVIEVA